LSRVQQVSEDDDTLQIPDERMPLMGSSFGGKAGTPRGLSGYGGPIPIGSPGGGAGRFGGLFRRPSGTSSRSSRRATEAAKSHQDDDYDVNNPPSVPSSPKLGPNLHYDDVMLTSGEADRGRSQDRQQAGDTLIDIDDHARSRSSSESPLHQEHPLNRRLTVKAEDDVCFPLEGLSEIGEDDFQKQVDQVNLRYRRRRRRKWPDLSYLEEWATEEKEQRTMEGIRTQQISEPLMIGGRLRPIKSQWHRQEDDNPFRFTYFNDEFENTIHSQSISELLQPGQTFRTLFMPDPPVLSDSSSDEDDTPLEDNLSDRKSPLRSPLSMTAPSANDSTVHSRMNSDPKHVPSNHGTGQNTPSKKAEKPKRYGPRPVFWLDVFCPTDAEMKVLSKAFGIHPLTAEDIMMQEAREKVELFRHYYFVNYRSFEQDTSSSHYLEPVNMYVVVFREGVISFHFSQTPHPANVRRRIRQLSDYLFLTTDWISYAIIDDVTDAFGPLIERIEEEVDEIDEAILTLHVEGDESTESPGWKRWREKFLDYDALSIESKDKPQMPDKTMGDRGRDMLRRTGETRKKVMSLYRLLGNKADVIKGFAKRCNEQWEVAPRSEIGLYLGDIQDHIVTMTGNLSHYEKYVISHLIGCNVC